MKIYYFTSSMRQEDFSTFKNSWSISLNPSGQNFHDKIIHALSSTNSVEVFSFIPYNKNYCSLSEIKSKDVKDGAIAYHYLPNNGHNTLYISHLNNIKVNSNEPGIIITETINIRVLINALYFSKRHNLKIIGICSDSPKNITGMNNVASRLLLHYGKKLDGYITLTEELNKLYNTNQQPSTIIHGIVDLKSEESTNVYGKYIFYGGTLLEKYGVYNLINAFKELNNPLLKLVICGHHANKEKLEPLLNDKIIFLGNLDCFDVIKLETNALMCVNPRPLNKDIDECSFPSKVLEYLASGSIVVSTKNPILMEEFKNEIIWAETDDISSIKNAINSVLLSDTDSLHEKKIKAKAKLEAYYSYSAIEKKINDLIKLIVS